MRRPNQVPKPARTALFANNVRCFRSSLYQPAPRVLFLTVGDRRVPLPHFRSESDGPHPPKAHQIKRPIFPFAPFLLAFSTPPFAFFPRLPAASERERERERELSHGFRVERFRAASPGNCEIVAGEARSTVDLGDGGEQVHPRERIRDP